MTPLTAVTTPDTVLAPGWAARSLTDVLRVDSAELSALVWACHWPCASLTKVARAVLTLPRSAVSWLTAPAPTLTSLRLSSEVRKAAALAHRSASGDAVDAEAVTDGVVPLAGVLADEVLPLDPHPAASSARPQVIMASPHRAAPFAMRRFISREATVRHQNAPHPSGTIPGPRPSWPQSDHRRVADLARDHRDGSRGAVVACHGHGTFLSGFLPRGWDHPVASDGTTRRVVPGVLVTFLFGCLQVVGLGGSGGWCSGRLL